MVPNFQWTGEALMDVANARLTACTENGEPPKLRELGADIVRLASVEGLTGHGSSVELRLQKIRRARREREAAREIEL